jgi:predicted metal-binding transcription factor (methanogenesis marker protein 9)
MKRLAILFALVTSPTWAQTVTLTREQLAAHDKLIATRAAAQQILGEAQKEAESTEELIAKSLNPPAASPRP